MLLNPIKNGLGLFILMSLAACGGGGSDSSDNTTPLDPPPVTTNQAPTVNNAISDQVTRLAEPYAFDISQQGQTFSDPDGDALSYSITISPNNSALTLTGTELSGTPNQAQTLTIVVTATDPGGLAVSETFLLKVNGAPIVEKAITNQTALVGETYSFDASQQNTTFREPNGDELEYDVLISPEGSGLMAVSTTISGTLQQAGTFTISLTATDPEGLNASTSYQLEVINPPENNPPTVANTIINQTVFTNTAYSFDVSQNGTTFNDPDGDALSYAVEINPDNTELTLSGSILSGTPTSEGVFQVTVTASDPEGLFATTSFTLTQLEQAQNNPPSLANPISDQSAFLNQAYEFDMSQNNTTFSDPDGDNLRYQVSISPENSGLTATDLSLSGTPIQNGTIEVVVTASDPEGLTVSDSFTVTVSAEVNNDKPNILLIIADDLGQDSSNQYAFSTDLPSTPNIDQIAQQGLVFENLWVNPVCTPTRATIFTGKYGTRTNVLAPGDELSLTETSLPQALANHSDTADYVTAKIGKWHLGGNSARPLEFGLDYYAGILNGGVQDYYNWQLDRKSTRLNSSH